MEATLSKLVTLLSSIAHQLAERVRAVARIASRERPADPDVARLFELPLDLMGVASIDGTILRVNPGFERVLGLAPEEILGRRLVEIVHPDDREATAAVFAGVLESGELSVFENRLPAADGSHRWLEWNVLADADEGLVYEPQPFPAQAERRVSQFTELVATGIANAEARAEVQRLADEQAALRRVATLVAEGAAPAEVFNAVIGEVAQLVGAAQVGLMRSESSHEISILAQRGQDPAVIRPGMRLPLDGDSVTARVLRTERSARINLYDEPGGTIADIAHRSNVNATVGAPITVEGALWGVITASWEGQDLPPVDAEERLAEFAELLDTAIANADSRDQLTASRARVLTAGDEARRRVVRDLHDGGQQRLVHTIVTLKLAQRALSEDRERTGSLLAEALDHAEQGNTELRELAHGILPAVLTRGGLRAGVDALVSRLDLLVEVDVTSTRLPPEIEASAYFIVAEALTNVVKHSRAARAQVTAAIDDGTLSIEVRDDGIGGADPEGHGLLGIGDRAAALGGRLRIGQSARRRHGPGRGTAQAGLAPLPADRESRSGVRLLLCAAPVAGCSLQCHAHRVVPSNAGWRESVHSARAR
jgi:PAS domain S-box-containing protein